MQVLGTSVCPALQPGRLASGIFVASWSVAILQTGVHSPLLSIAYLQKPSRSNNKVRQKHMLNT
jgi:hypothetical protein